MENNKTPIENGKERDERGKFVYGNQASVGHGRPKNKPSIPNMIKTIGNKIPEGETKTRFELMNLKLWGMALKGNIRAIELICNRDMSSFLISIQPQDAFNIYLANRTISF